MPGPGYVATRFLSQAVLEKVFHTGFDAAAYLSTPVGDVQALLTYTFEWVLDGSVRGTSPVAGNNSINNYLSLGVSLTY